MGRVDIGRMLFSEESSHCKILIQGGQVAGQQRRHQRDGLAGCAAQQGGRSRNCSVRAQASVVPSCCLCYFKD